jgi:hypothetical protein
LSQSVPRLCLTEESFFVNTTINQHPGAMLPLSSIGLEFRLFQRPLHQASHFFFQENITGRSP